MIPRRWCSRTDQRSVDRWFNTSIFNRNSAQALASNIRTFPYRFSNVRFDAQRRLDLSVNKTFAINERFRMRFRADCFNVENTPVLRGPNTDPVNGAFGTITAQEPPRSFQFSSTFSSENNRGSGLTRYPCRWFSPESGFSVVKGYLSAAEPPPQVSVVGPDIWSLRGHTCCRVSVAAVVFHYNQMRSASGERVHCAVVCYRLILPAVNHEVAIHI